MNAKEIAKMIATEGLTDEESIALYADEIKAYAKKNCIAQRESDAQVAGDCKELVRRNRIVVD